MHGGGILALSSYAMMKMPDFQSTLRHELGHTFGLPHVEVYGYDMKNNPSIMSHTLSHYTNWFKDSETPGELIPEDHRGLARNQNVLPGLKFDPTWDVPATYHIFKETVGLPPMQLPADDN